MRITETFGIIAKQVLNDNTGELEYQTFREEKVYKTIKGGFTMIYKSYDEAMLEIVKSNKDLAVVLMIRNMFTKQRVEVVISRQDVSKVKEVSIQKVSTIIKDMVETGMLKRIDKGVYRFNPFMYLPYQSNGEALQAEWKEL